MTQKEKLTSLLSEATIGEGKFTVRDFFLPLSIEKIAEQLMAGGVLAPVLSIGQRVHVIIDYDVAADIGEEHCPCTVTEVGAQGFWLSSYEPPEDDISEFIKWDELGNTVFLTSEEAAEAVERRKNGVGA